MGTDVKHKLFMGLRGLMVRIPSVLSERGARRGAEGAKENAARLSAEERRVHHFIVRKLVSAREPITAESVAGELGMTTERANAIIDRLEELKTFVFRSDGRGIDWAYPLSLENTGFRLTATSGERFFAA